METLLAGFRRAFPKLVLTGAEKQLLLEALSGRPVDFSAEAEEGRQVGVPSGNEVAIRSSVIEWLCTDCQVRERIHPRGLLLRGARITGTLDLRFASVPFPVGLAKCSLPDGAHFDGAKLRFLDLGRSSVGAITAVGAAVDGSLLMRAGRATAGLSLQGARIGGDLDLDSAQLGVAEGYSLNAETAQIQGDVFLRDGFAAAGEVSFAGAWIGGDLDCARGSFSGQGGRALTICRAEVKGDVYLGLPEEEKDFSAAEPVRPGGGFQACGEVDLSGARIRGDLVCTSGSFVNIGKCALAASGASIGGSVFLNEGLRANGEVQVIAARVVGDVICANAELSNPSGAALTGNRLKVEGSLFLGGQKATMKVEGGVFLVGAEIGGDLDCQNGRFSGAVPQRAEEKVAIDAARAIVGGSVFFGGEEPADFASAGEVSVIGARIGGDLYGENGAFSNPDGTALNADGADISGDVFLRRGFTAFGKVRFPGAVVKGWLHFRGAAHKELRVDLRSARVHTLWDDPRSWPDSGKLELHGFQFQELAPEALKVTAADRIRWLHLQADDQFYTQPYEHLAKVLREGGHDEEARRVLIAKQEDIGKRMSCWRKPFHWLFGHLAGYGYRPWRLLMLTLVVVSVSTVLFTVAERAGVMVPTDSRLQGSGRTGFNPFVYSLDIYIPLLDLGQDTLWTPRQTELVNYGTYRLQRAYGFGRFLLYWSWLAKTAGWIFGTLFAATLTGVIRQQKT